MEGRSLTFEECDERLAAGWYVDMDYCDHNCSAQRNRSYVCLLKDFHQLNKQKKNLSINYSCLLSLFLAFCMPLAGY